MASLYNISNDILTLFENIENNDGEITEEEYSTLLIKKEELKEKLDNYVKAVKEFKKDADFCKAEKKNIDARKKVFENRVDRLKNAMIVALNQFGEEGKNNKYIELPTCRISTRNVPSVCVDEERINILLQQIDNYLHEIVNGDVLYVGEDVDLQGVLDAINANVIAEQGEDFKPYALADLTTLKIKLSTTATLYELFRHHKDAIMEHSHNALTANIEDNTVKEDWKTIININEQTNLNLPTCAYIAVNQSLIIK